MNSPELLPGCGSANAVMGVVFILRKVADGQNPGGPDMTIKIDADVYMEARIHGSALGRRSSALINRSGATPASERDFAITVWRLDAHIGVSSSTILRL